MVSNNFSSELIKLASNAFLAQRISSINSISAICDKTNANIGDVARGIGLDTRIGKKYLGAGLGFGGYCLEKDTRCLAYLALSLGLPEVADYWSGVVKLNIWQKQNLANKVIDHYDGCLGGVKILILGMAFKGNTADVRNSCFFDVFEGLRKEPGAEIYLLDPFVSNVEVAKEYKRLYGVDLIKTRYTSSSKIHLDSNQKLPLISEGLTNLKKLDGEVRRVMDLGDTVEDQPDILLKKELEVILEYIEKVDCVVVTIDHSFFKNFSEFLVEKMTPRQVLFDGKNMFDVEQFASRNIKLVNFGKKY